MYRRHLLRNDNGNKYFRSNYDGKPWTTRLCHGGYWTTTDMLVSMNSITKTTTTTLMGFFLVTIEIKRIGISFNGWNVHQVVVRGWCVVQESFQRSYFSCRTLCCPILVHQQVSELLISVYLRVTYYSGVVYLLLLLGGVGGLHQYPVLFVNSLRYLLYLILGDKSISFHALNKARVVHNFISREFFGLSRSRTGCSNIFRFIRRSHKLLLLLLRFLISFF